MNRTPRKLLANSPPLTRITRPIARPSAAATLAAFLLVLCAAPQGKGATVDPATLAASKAMEAKLEILGDKASQPVASPRAVVVTEYQVNSYMKVHSGESLPKGIHAFALSIQPEHATASGDIDFEELSRSYPNPNDVGPKILAAMFHGTQHTTVTAKIQSEAAGYRVQIESVAVGSMTVPKWLLDYVIQNVLQPQYKLDLSKPLPYPDHVTQIVLGSRQATFLRGSGKVIGRQ